MNKASSEVRAFIGLGSNLSEPELQIRSARQAVGSHPDIQEIAFSRLYRSAPMGPADQPDYVNAAMLVATTLDAHQLLYLLQKIEQQQGRVRTGLRWGPRTLDLDLLLYGDEQIETPDLIVPHPGVAERAFVLYPLNDIDPMLEIPGRGIVKNLVAGCSDESLSPMP